MIAIRTICTQNTTFYIHNSTGGTLDSILFDSNSVITEPVNLTAPKLTIKWFNWNIGINNVSFNQQAVAPTNVPEPGVLALMGSMRVEDKGLFLRRLRFA